MSDDDEKALSGLVNGGLSMSDFWACVIAEFRALGMWCFIHGPEIWLGLCIWCAVSIAILLGMWLAALLSANGRDDDENKRNL